MTTFKKQKHILIATGIFPPDIGGPATYLSQFVGSLIDKNYDVSVVTYADTLNGEDHDDDIPVYRVVRCSGFFGKFFRYLRFVSKQARKADLIYLHDITSSGLAVLLVHLSRRIPYIVRIGGDATWEQAYQRGQTKLDYKTFQIARHPFKISLKRSIAKQVCLRATRVIVPSEFLRSNIVLWGVPEDRIQVVHNAIDVQALKTTETKQSDLTEFIEEQKKKGMRIIVASGRLVNWKRTDMIIRAMDKADDVMLFVVGDGPESKALSSLVSQKKLQERVRFIQTLPRDQLFDLFRRSDAFVLMSMGDTFSFVALEAYLAGTRLILAREGALPEIFGSFEGKGISFVSDTNELQNVLTRLKESSKPTEGDQRAMAEQYQFSKHVSAVHAIIKDTL